jgi:NitT/TauT family transport system substrate-binding protein
MRCGYDRIHGMPVGVYWSKNTFIKAHPQVVDAFIASIREAVDYLRADANRARDEIADYVKMDRAILDQMPLIGWDYRIRLDKWQAVVHMMSKYVEIKPRPAHEYFAPQLRSLISK